MSKDEKEMLGVVVEKHYQSPSVDNPELAEIVAVIDYPTYKLKDADGNEYIWVQHLTRVASEGQSAEYWKQRALKAETRNTEQATVTKARCKFCGNTYLDHLTGPSDHFYAPRETPTDAPTRSS